MKRVLSAILVLSASAAAWASAPLVDETQLLILDAAYTVLGYGTVSDGEMTLELAGASGTEVQMTFVTPTGEAIPLVGTVLFWGIGSVIALFANPVSALFFAAAYLVYMQLEAYVLTPKVMNKTISVPGSLVVIGALVGGTLMGLLGALVAIPVTALVLLIVKKVLIPKQDAKV